MRSWWIDRPTILVETARVCRVEIVSVVIRLAVPSGVEGIRVRVHHILVVAGLVVIAARVVIIVGSRSKVERVLPLPVLVVPVVAVRLCELLQVIVALAIPIVVVVVSIICAMVVIPLIAVVVVLLILVSTIVVVAAILVVLINVVLMSRRLVVVDCLLLLDRRR